MIKEIGSEFWLSKLPDVIADDHVPFWITKLGNTMLTVSGRGAISLLLQEIEPGLKTALLPAYCCETMITPFLAKGYECLFYDIDLDLTTNADMIDCSNIGVLLHMSYYGFPGNSGVDVLKNNFDKTVMVEDATHSLFTESPAATHNDFIVASLRKWMGLPGGGLLASHCRPIVSELPERATEITDLRKAALQLKAHYIQSADDELKPRYLELFAQAEEMLNKDVSAYRMDEASKAIVSSVDLSELRGRRRENFAYLLTAAQALDYLEPVFKELSGNVCPLFFPVYIEGRRDEVRQALIAEDIYCPIHWPVPPQVDLARYPNAKYIYENILSLPCDQRYGLKDMERMEQALQRQGK